MFVVSDTSKLRVYVNVPQSFVPAIRIGRKAMISVPEYRRPQLPGEQLSFLPRPSTAQSGTTRMQLIVGNDEGLLLAGGYANVRIDLSRDMQTLHIPASALLFDQNGLRVATVGAGEKVVLKSIKIARDLGREYRDRSGAGAPMTGSSSPAGRPGRRHAGSRQQKRPLAETTPVEGWTRPRRRPPPRGALGGSLRPQPKRVAGRAAGIACLRLFRPLGCGQARPKTAGKEMRSGRWRNHGAAWRLQTRHPGAAPSGNALLGKGLPGLGQTIVVGIRRKIDKGGGRTLGAVPTARPRPAPGGPSTPDAEPRKARIPRRSESPATPADRCLPAAKKIDLSHGLGAVGVRSSLAHGQHGMRAISLRACSSGAKRDEAMALEGARTTV